MIGNGALTLWTHEEQRKRLLGRPERMAAAVDEALRYESLVQNGNALLRFPSIAPRFRGTILLLDQTTRQEDFHS